MQLIEFVLFGFAICIGTLMLVTPLISLTKKPHLMDVFWSIGICLSILISTWFFSPQVIMSPPIFMVGVWAIRLSCFLFYTRILSNFTDRRYENQLKSSYFKLAFKHAMIQAPMQALFLFTIYPIILAPTLSTSLIIFGSGISLIGLLGETIADFQLFMHKKNSNGLMKEGLWKYSRHPNYFFETLVWTGISVMFIGNPGSAVSFIGPISIFIITFFITGPITEKTSLEKHASAFQNYQSHTLYFFPWFPK